MKRSKKARRSKDAESPAPPESTLSTSNAGIPKVQRDSQEPGAAIKSASLRYTYVGPLPLPEMLAKYDQALPGTAQTIVREFTEESDHRRALANKKADAQIHDERMGQWFGFILGLVGLIMGGTVVMVCQTTAGATAGGAIGGAALVSLVTVFVVGRRKQPEAPRARETSADKPG